MRYHHRTRYHLHGTSRKRSEVSVQQCICILESLHQRDKSICSKTGVCSNAVILTAIHWQTALIDQPDCRVREQKEHDPRSRVSRNVRSRGL
jgi:hypothetical protein